MRPSSKLLRRESTTSCSARSGSTASTAYSRIVRNWIIYLDMSGLMARKQDRPLEQPPIAAGTEPLARIRGVFRTAADTRRSLAAVGTPFWAHRGTRLGYPGMGRWAPRAGRQHGGAHRDASRAWPC